MDKGEYSEVLPRLIWYYTNVSPKDPGNSYIYRNNFVLNNWKRLSKSYQPAHDSLVVMRDKRVKEFFTGKEYMQRSFEDVIAINRQLKDANSTIKFFKEVQKNYNEFARRNWFWAKNDLITTNNYILVADYIKTPYSDSRRGESYVVSALKRSRLKGEQKKLNGLAISRYVNDVVFYANVALCKGDIDTAKQIKKQGLSIIESDKIKQIKIN